MGDATPEKGGPPPPIFLTKRVQSCAGAILRVVPLREMKAACVEGEEIWLTVVDPSERSGNPGWLLRNALALARYHWCSTPGSTTTTVQVPVLCYREGRHPGAEGIEGSVVFHVTISLAEEGEPCPKTSGWEANEKKGNKPAPRVADLGTTMDPARLAESAADLNLELMRWRALPSLDLPKLQATKCLLVGAGTLGCQVARNLMAWGIRHVTFIDSGKVSYSNPVRQSLFEFKDCLEGGQYKAEAAAAHLKAVFPSMEATGVVMAIPMPGHSVPNSHHATVAEDVAKLEALIKEHDVVFQLTDTRESRWLPTVLARVHNKITINIALGFDTYLAMRHGAAPTVEQVPHLGCYFCNDAAAELHDSMKDRTLDQQCTVTRPGLTGLASSMGTELLVGILHHEQGAMAPADPPLEMEERTETPLGLLPHQIRGSMRHFNSRVLHAEGFDRCIGCSPAVVSAYVDRGMEFCHQCFDSPTYLQEITGLKKLFEDVEDLDMGDWGDSEDDGF